MRLNISREYRTKRSRSEYMPENNIVDSQSKRDCVCWRTAPTETDGQTRQIAGTDKHEENTSRGVGTDLVSRHHPDSTAGWS